MLLHVWNCLSLFVISRLVKRRGARWRQSILGLAKVSVLSAFVAWKLEVLTFHFTHRHRLTWCPAAQIRCWTEGVVCLWHWLIVFSSVSNDRLAPAADTRVDSSKRWPRMKQGESERKPGWTGHVLSLLIVRECVCLRFCVWEWLGVFKEQQ